MPAAQAGVSLDTSFVAPNLNGTVRAAAVDGAGRIVAGGDFYLIGTPQNNSRDNLARFNADGTLDTTFADPNIDTAASPLSRIS